MHAIFHSGKTGLTGWRAYALVFVLGAIAPLGLAPFFIWPLFFVSLSGLLWLLDTNHATPRSMRRRIRAAAAIGWWFGFGYFLSGLRWIGEAFLVEAEKFAVLMPFAVAAMPAGLAMFYAIAAGLAARFWSGGPERLLLFAVALGGAEWLRGHIFTGFPWNLLGYSLTGSDWLIGSAAVFGTYGLTFIALLIFAAPAALRAWWRTAAPVAGLAGLALISLVMAGRAPAPLPAQIAALEENGQRLRLVQPNTSQRDKMNPNLLGTHLAQLLLLSRDGVLADDADLSLALSSRPADGGFTGISHVFWPETAVPFLYLDSAVGRAMLADIVPANRLVVSGVHRLAGELASPDRQVFNSIAVYGGDGNRQTFYDKRHLVPFGEYLPFTGLLERIGLQALTRMRGGFTSGENPRRLAIPGLPAAAPLICYEVIFPGELYEPGDRPHVLLNLTNDSWFGNTAGPYQHLHQSRVRAVEEGIPLLRVANTGVSAVINGHGDILASLPLNTAGVIDTVLPPRLSPTPYSQLGDVGLLIMLMMSLLIWLRLRSRSDADRA